MILTPRRMDLTSTKAVVLVLLGAIKLFSGLAPLVLTRYTCNICNMHLLLDLNLDIISIKDTIQLDKILIICASRVLKRRDRCLKKFIGESYLVAIKTKDKNEASVAPIA